MLKNECVMVGLKEGVEKRTPHGCVIIKCSYASQITFVIMPPIQRHF